MNFFYYRFTKTPILSFTILLLLFYRVLSALEFALSNGGNTIIIERYGMTPIILICVSLLFYSFWWLLATYFLAKMDMEKLKEKFYKHPIFTIVGWVGNFVATIIRIPNGAIGKLININIFETIVYDLIVSFLWGYGIVGIMEKIYNRGDFVGKGGRFTVDRLFVVVIIFYKILLGFETFTILMIFLFFIIKVVFKYKATDLIKILN